MTPSEVDDCSLWQFSAAVSGWVKANGGEEKPRSPTPEEHDALVAKYAHI